MPSEGPLLRGFVLQKLDESLSKLWCLNQEHPITIKTTKLDLGSWYTLKNSINLQEVYETDVKKSAVEFPTRVRNGKIEVNVPFIMLGVEEKQFVGYSPGIGRVGAFKKLDLKNQHFYRLWVTWIGKPHGNTIFEQNLKKYDVDWVVGPQEIKEPMELYDFVSIRNLHITMGLILEVSDSYIKIWSEDNEICTRPIYTIDLEDLKKFTIGTWVKFIPVKTFQGTNLAVHMAKTNGPKGSSLIEVEPISSSSPNSSAEQMADEIRPSISSSNSTDSVNQSKIQLKINLLLIKPTPTPRDYIIKHLGHVHDIDGWLDNIDFHHLSPDAYAQVCFVFEENLWVIEEYVDVKNPEDDKITIEALVVGMTKHFVKIFPIKNQYVTPFMIPKAKFDVSPSIGNWYRVTLSQPQDTKIVLISGKNYIGENMTLPGNLVQRATQISAPISTYDESDEVQVFVKVNITKSEVKRRAEQFVTYSEDIGRVVIPRSVNLPIGQEIEIWCTFDLTDSMNTSHGAYWFYSINPPQDFDKNIDSCLGESTRTYSPLKLEYEPSPIIPHVQHTGLFMSLPIPRPFIPPLMQPMMPPPISTPFMPAFLPPTGSFCSGNQASFDHGHNTSVLPSPSGLSPSDVSNSKPKLSKEEQMEEAQKVDQDLIRKMFATKIHAAKNQEDDKPQKVFISEDMIREKMLGKK